MKYFFSALIVLCTSLPLSSQTLLGSYNFNGGSGTDNSGNGNTGTVNGPSTGSNNELVIGSNVNDYFTLPASLIHNKQAFSISFKIKFTALNASGAFATNHIVSGDNPSLEGAVGLSYQVTVTKWRFALNGVLYDFFDDSVLPGIWYCVTLTRDASSTIQLYVNGIQHVNVYNDNSLTYVTNFLIGQETDCTGGCFDPAQCTYGQIDDLKIYNGAISVQTASLNCDLCQIPDAPLSGMSPNSLQLCENAPTTTLTASGSGTLQWFSSNSPAAPVISIGTAYSTPVLTVGTHTFYVSSLTCTNSPRTAIVVTVHPRPVLGISDGTVCAGDPWMFNLNSALNYTFSSGNGIVSPSVTTVYTITGISQPGCWNTAYPVVYVNPLPPVAVSGASVMCDGSLNSLYAGGASSYTWNTGSTMQFINVAPTTNTIYVVTGTDQYGCFATAVHQVTVSQCVGLQDLSGSTGVSIHPNPVVNSIHIESHSGHTYEIITSDGRKMSSGVLKEGTTTLLCEDWPAGFYHLLISDGGVVNVYRVVKTQ